MQKMAMMPAFNRNKGNFLSAKIYSDVRGNACECGGKFTKRQKEMGVSFPVCDSCANGRPNKYRIVATFEDDETREKIRVTLRTDQQGKRLESQLQVGFWLETVKREIEAGEFDVNLYKSEEKRREFKFENFSKVYLAHHEKRLNKGEITPSGLRNKKNYTGKLVKHFRGFDIGNIRTGKIEEFKVLFEESDSQLNHCLQELKAILYYAHKMEKIHYVPSISVKKTSKRKQTMDLATGLKIIEKIKNPVVQHICQILAIYPVRPGEVRALRWKDVDLMGGSITFCSHFSDNKIIEGRKSRKIDEQYGSLTLPLTQAAREVINLQVRDIDPDGFVFKGQRGPYVSNNAFNSAWRKAREAAGFSPTREMKYDLYELKHAVLSELNAKSGGNLKTLEKASGVDIKTLMERYVYSHDDLATIYQ